MQRRRHAAGVIDFAGSDGDGGRQALRYLAGKAGAGDDRRRPRPAQYLCGDFVQKQATARFQALGRPSQPGSGRQVRAHPLQRRPVGVAGNDRQRQIDAGQRRRQIDADRQRVGKWNSRQIPAVFPIPAQRRKLIRIMAPQPHHVTVAGQ